MIIGIGISCMAQCIDVKSVESKVYKMVQTLLQQLVEKKTILMFMAKPKCRRKKSKMVA